MAEYFVNPYTFVSLRDGKTLCTVSQTDEKLTGKITCTLITKTQICIPDLENGKDEHGINKHPFFRADGKAVIPGSSIRGVIRNVYEALTNSCMHINDKDDDYFSSRQNKKNPGLLTYEDGKYVLYNAKRRKVTDRIDKDLKTGDIVSYTCISNKFGEKAESLKFNSKGTGVFLRVDTFGKPPKQNHPSVFEKGSRESEIDEKTIKAFNVNIDRYEPKNNYVQKQYLGCFNAMKKGEKMLPVWYCEKNGNYYFAPSQFSRSVFIQKPKDILQKMGYSPCNKKQEMCEACNLFGMVGLGKNAVSVSGKVRFGDAVCYDDNCFDKYYVLPVLGSPRLSSFEFYLKNETGKYKVVKDRFGNNLLEPIDPDEEDTVIAGRKFYWHHNGKRITSDDEKAVEIADEAKKINKTEFASSDNCCELVKAGSRFTFDIYFDGITEDQLKKLVFALNFGENSEDSVHCHKIGHGKPIGLGSAKIVVNNITKREFADSKYCLSDLTNEFSTPCKEELFDKAEYDQVLKVVNMNTIDSDLISYPYTSDGVEAFTWFANNRETMRTGEGMAKIRKRLPALTDKFQTLPVYYKQNGKPRKSGDSYNSNKKSNSGSKYESGSVGGGHIQIKDKRRRK